MTRFFHSIWKATLWYSENQGGSGGPPTYNGWVCVENDWRKAFHIIKCFKNGCAKEENHFTEKLKCYVGDSEPTGMEYIYVWNKGYCLRGVQCVYASIYISRQKFTLCVCMVVTFYLLLFRQTKLFFGKRPSSEVWTPLVHSFKNN